MQHVNDPIRILVANSKGGSGKTTIATNVAAYFARQQEGTVLIDFDDQGSSMQWLQARHKSLPSIHGIAAYKHLGSQTRSFVLRKLPDDTSRVIVDTAAGLKKNDLNEMIREADIMLIPVTPSAIDIRATTSFIKEILLSPAFRSRPVILGAVANRARKNTLVYTKLELFLNSLKIPFVATIRDTQYYVRAAEQGMGLHDLPQRQKADLAEWEDLSRWLDDAVERCKQRRLAQSKASTSQSA